MATGTWGNIGTTSPDAIVYRMSMIDASADRWTEDLVTALTATLAAVQAWIVLYQNVTQASIWQVERAEIWGGAMESSNADFAPRFEVKNGINLSFRTAATNDLTSLRVVAPDTDAMQGTTDIPVVNAGALADLIVASPGVLAGTPAFTTAQYTIHRERKGNPKVS